MTWRTALKRLAFRTSVNDLSKVTPISSIFGLERGTPVDRFYIEKFLNSHSEFIKGNCGEIGESFYSEKYGSVKKKEIFDISSDNKKATIVGDLTKMESLPKSTLDCFIVTQTYNFIFEFDKAIEGTHKMLKPGGVALATMAGICQISRYDMDRWGDYWRFTSLSAKKSFEKVFGEGNVEVVAFGNVAACIGFLQGCCVEDFPDRTIFDKRDPNYELLIGVIARKAN